MANSKLIKERNLDPELLAKILSSGSSVDVQGVLKDYVKKTDKIEKKQLGDTVISYIEDMAGQGTSGLGSYYRKGETIDINDIPQSLISDVSNASASAAKANKALENVSQTISDEAATKVNEYIQNTDIVGTTYKSVKQELDETYNPKFQYYDEQIPSLINKINTNSTSIAGVQERYRRKDELITYADLDADVTNKFESLTINVSNLNDTKQDKLYGDAGSIIYMKDDSPIPDDIFISGAYVINSIDRSYAASKHISPIIDFSTFKKYTTIYEEWNYNEHINNDNIGVLNNTVSDGYTRYNVTSSNYIISDSSAISETDDGYFTITAPESSKIRIALGFWGTKCKLNGQIQKRPDQESDQKQIDIFIDSDDMGTLDIYGDNVLDTACIFSTTELSEGRHRIDIRLNEGSILKLNKYMDLDSTNSAVLLSADIPDLSIYESLFDKQDTFINMPSTYTTISKSADLFDISTKTIDALYNIEPAPELYMIDGNNADNNDNSLKNHILLSTISDSAFLIKNNAIQILRYHFEYDITIPKGSTTTYTSPALSNILSYSISVLHKDSDGYSTMFPKLTNNNNFVITRDSTVAEKEDSVYHITLTR